MDFYVYLASSAKLFLFFLSSHVGEKAVSEELGGPLGELGAGRKPLPLERSKPCQTFLPVL